MLREERNTDTSESSGFSLITSFKDMDRHLARNLDPLAMELNLAQSTLVTTSAVTHYFPFRKNNDLSLSFNMINMAFHFSSGVAS